MKPTVPIYLRQSLTISKIAVILFFISAINPLFGQDYYEAESYPVNLGNATVASSESGFNGSGYVTNITSEWSEVKFGKSNGQTQPAQLAIRYSNGSGSNFTNLGFKVGSQSIQTLSFPSTGSWSTWDILLVDFTFPAGYLDVVIDGLSNVSQSVNIDGFELRFGNDIQSGGGGPDPVLPGSFSQSTPSNNASGISLTPTLTWVSSSNADTYQVVISTSSNLSSPFYNETFSSANTSCNPTGLSYSSTYYWGVTATNSDGSTEASNAGISFTVEDAPVGTAPPGSFSLSSPSNGASDLSTSPTLTWGSSSDASNYNVVVSTSSNLSNPVLSQSTTGTSLGATGLSYSTTYYWGVTASNSDGSTAASNNGRLFSTEADPNAGGGGNPPATSGVVYEAESMNRGNAQVSSAGSGYSGSGYVTEFISEWSTLKFEKSYSDVTPAVVNIRYSNGTGQTVTNIDLMQGSAKVQDLSFPPTSGWNDYQILTSIPFNIAAGYQGILLDGTQNVSESVNIDYIELLEGYTPPPGTFTLTSPTNGANDQALSLSLTWTSSTSATSYEVVVDNNSNFASPIVTQSQTGTSYSLSGLSYSTTYYWKVTASNAEGSEVETASFSTLAPPPPVGSFSHSSPANAATDVATSVALTWGASAKADSYSLVVSTNSNLSNPIVSAGGISGTSYNVNLADGTTYYWQVTAANEVSSTSATKTSFTTLVPPAPGSFSYVSPANGASGVSRAPQLSWTASDFANNYSIIISTNSNLSNPAVDITGVTGINYSASGLAELTTYYWSVTAVNSTGSKTISGGSRSFTTQEAPEGYHVSPSGSDIAGNGSSGNPWKTIAYAASQVPANQDLTIYLAAGTFTETEPIELPTGVNVEGAGEDQTFINSSGVTLPAGITGAEGDYRLWPDGSLFQLVSIPYTNGSYYGPPEEMAPAIDGNQTLSGFTINGQGTLKAGIWVMSRNNVTAHHITIKNTKMNGAVFGKSDMWWYEAMPDGAWMKNTTIHDMKFINAAEAQKGCLRLAGLDGAEIYNIDIDDQGGAYGIKFMYVGHYKNLSIHDCNIRVSDYDPEWGEAISIELWNFARASNSEIYNINCNTWLSLVNHTQIPSYEPEGDNVDALDLHHVVMIDEDGSSQKEAIEAALSGVKIHDCYLQDKGFGIAIWNGVGSLLKKNYEIYNNVITNVDRDPGFGFANSSAIFIPDPAQNVKIYNNVFERMGVALEITAASDVDVKNNIFIKSEGDDIKGGSGNASYNLKYHTNPQKAAFNSSLGGSNNITGNPGLKETGPRSTQYTFGSYYEPASTSSLVVDAGTDVGLSFGGSAPDIGAFEFNSIPTQAPAAFSLSAPAENAKDVSVNPTLTWNSSQFAQSYTLEVASNSNFNNIIYAQPNITNTSVVVNTALSYTTQYYWRVTAINIIGNKVSNGSLSFTTEDVPPPPASFSLSAPSDNGTNVSKTPTFSWTASASASSYTLVVSASSNYSNPVINQANIPGTSVSPAVALADVTKYYWKVTAVNSVGTEQGTGNGRSFTTTSGPLVGNGLVNYERFLGVPGNTVNNLLNSPNYPLSPDEVSTLSSVDVPREQGSDFGQIVWGYLLPQETGSYHFWVAGDDQVEFHLSTDATKANKAVRASVPDWTNPEQYDKFGSQSSDGIELQEGMEYYFEVIHKEKDGGDHMTLAWQTPSASTRSTLSGTVLSSVRNTQLPTPGAFTLSAPANNSTDVSRVPTLTWTASDLVESYSIVISTNSNLSNPVVSEIGLPNNAYTLPEALNTSTTYFWDVTATNEGGEKTSGNGSRSFTTEDQPLPGSFSAVQPSDGVSGTSWNPFFSWTSSFEANSYTITVSENANLSSPVINESGVIGTSYTVTSSLNANTTYYWTVSADNNSGSTTISDGTLDFTTGSQDGLIHVMLSGNNGTGNGTASNPYRTVAYAASQAPADEGNTIFIHPGEFVETAEIIVPTGVNILGSGEGVTTLKAGNLGDGGGKEDFGGALIQLISASYVVDQYSPAVAPSNGNQNISGFTIDGSGKSLKAGIWLQARNNVTIHHITIEETQQRGAVACFGQKKAREEPPYYINNLVMHDLTFINAGSDLSDESLGNLNLAHTDGAEIYNITINDVYGYGIKFIFEGYYKNTKIHDCIIQVNEDDPLWTEDIAIELWNLGSGNEVYNVDANTWFSFVNWPNTFNNPAKAGDHLKVYDCKIIDNDGTSLKEAIEAAGSGIEIYNCYIENKGWGIAQWLQGERKMSYHHNIFRNTQPQAVWSDAGAIFIVADEVPQMEDIFIYNNVFDNLYTSGGSPLKNISVWKGTVDGLDIANNVSINMDSETYDFFLYGAASVSNATYRSNLSDDAHNVTGITNMSGNIVDSPGFKQTGLRWDDYYQPASNSSLVVDAGVDVGLVYYGSAPDMGAWEFTTGNSARVAQEDQSMSDNELEINLLQKFRIFPNPTSNILNIGLPDEIAKATIEVVNGMGQVTITQIITAEDATIDFKLLSSGVYIIFIKHENGVEKLRVLKK